MKIKKFIAATMGEAIEQVRFQLGPDAVILANQTIEGQVHLTAAIDEVLDFDFKEDNSVQKINTRAFFDETKIRKALEYHGVLEVLSGKILSLCREIGAANAAAAQNRVLEHALSRLFRFQPLLGGASPFKIFMGTPGSGKSTAIAKLATQAKLKGIKSAIVSTDNSKAGANQQLKAFAEILEQDFFFFKDPKELFHFSREATGSYGRILIDTPGINPFIETETAKVAAFAEVLKADKIMTFDAGRNASETVEIAEIFCDLGASFLLPTRLDLTRRIGSVLSAAGCCDLTFCAAGVSASIASGLAPVDSPSLARLLLA